jgi:hypothetical protein
MVDAIFAFFVVASIFCVVGSLFAVYVWMVDKRQFAAWRESLHATRKAAEN